MCPNMSTILMEGFKELNLESWDQVPTKGTQRAKFRIKAIKFQYNAFLSQGYLYVQTIVFAGTLMLKLLNYEKAN